MGQGGDALLLPCCGAHSSATPSLHSKALCGFVFLTVLQLLLNLLKSYHPSLY